MSDFLGMRLCPTVHVSLCESVLSIMFIDFFLETLFKVDLEKELKYPQYINTLIVECQQGMKESFMVKCMSISVLNDLTSHYLLLKNCNRHLQISDNTLLSIKMPP